MKVVDLGVGEFIDFGEFTAIKVPKEAQKVMEVKWGMVKMVRFVYEGGRIYIEPIDTRKQALTLHEAIAYVISVMGPMKPSDIAREIRIRDLYKRRDGKYPKTNQIYARINNYPQYFRKEEDGRINLTEDGREIAENAKRKLEL